MKKIRLGVILLAFGLLSMSVAFKEDLFLVSKNLDIFASLYKEININYVEETDPSDLMRNGINAMLDGLDPYTEYIPESEIEDYKLKVCKYTIWGHWRRNFVYRRKIICK
jgi:carboxyl-terminal processing protease